MTDSKKTNETEEELPDIMSFIQRRPTKPVESHHVYLNPEAQPAAESEARGENPWTGETAQEVREKAFSEQQYQQKMREQDEEHVISSVNSKEKE